MKVFYNDQGQVVGWVSGSNQDTESGVTMPGTLEATPTAELERVISSTTSPTPLTSIQVVDGEVVLTDPTVSPSSDNT